MIPRPIVWSIALLATAALPFAGCSSESDAPVDGGTKEQSRKLKEQRLENDPAMVRTSYINDYYHTKECEDVRTDSVYTGSIEEAKVDGYTPCPKCNPPS